jgi:hypothetical protein
VKNLVVTAASLAILGSVFATAAQAAPRLIGASSASAPFAATTASGRSKKTTAVYVRGYGRNLSGQVGIACSRGRSIASSWKTLDSLRSGQLYRLSVPLAGDCAVTASLRGRGQIRLQILADG